MISSLADFISARAAETYPEPVSEAHTTITREMGARFANGLSPGARILDVGCGHGVALAMFRAMGFEPFGITVNPEDLVACRDAGHLAAGVDMHDIGDHWKHGAVDAVWARHVLEHSIAPFYVLHVFAEILRPGGKLYVEVPAPDTIAGHDCANKNHYTVLGARAWQSLIERAGFHVDESATINITLLSGPDAYVAFFCTKK